MSSMVWVVDKLSKPPVIPHTLGDTRNWGAPPIPPAGEKSPAPLFIIVGVGAYCIGYYVSLTPCIPRTRGTFLKARGHP
jgi:hypothetical protein